MRTKFCWGDGIVIVFTLLCAGLFLLGQGKKGDTLLVTTDTGTERYSLSVSREIPVTSNGYTLVITVSDCTASITSATCENQICVHSLPISRNGQSIICVPAHVLVTVEAETSEDIDNADWILS